MKKLLIRVPLAVFLVAALLWAGDPWKGKPYTEWTKSEVDRVLSDSPWARSVVLRGQYSQGAQGIGVTSGVGGGAGGVATGPAVQQGGPRLVVLWQSALTVRQATLRQQEFGGKPAGTQTEAFLSPTLPHYVIVVYGPPLKALRNVTEQVVSEETYLENPQRQDRVKPLTVRLIRQGGYLAAIELRFPRQSEGKPVVDPEQKKVRFYCGFRTAWVSADFDLGKMARDGRPDL